MESRTPLHPRQGGRNRGCLDTWGGVGAPIHWDKKCRMCQHTAHLVNCSSPRHACLISMPRTHMQTSRCAGVFSVIYTGASKEKMGRFLDSLERSLTYMSTANETLKLCFKNEVKSCLRSSPWSWHLSSTSMCTHMHAQPLCMCSYTCTFTHIRIQIAGWCSQVWLTAWQFYIYSQSMESSS